MYIVRFFNLLLNTSWNETFKTILNKLRVTCKVDEIRRFNPLNVYKFFNLIFDIVISRTKLMNFVYFMSYF